MATSLLGKLQTAAHIYANDIQLAIRFRGSAPLSFGLAWCDPCNIQLSTRYFVKREGGYLTNNIELPKETIHKKLSRFIAGGDWDYHTTPIENVKPISRTIHRYEKDLSWEEVGEIDWMMRNIKQYGIQDGCRSYDDVIARCNNLDKLKQHVEKKGQFSTQKKLNTLNFREVGGIGVAIGQNGDIIWLDNGAHRLAIARHLQLPEIPVCLQLIHPEALNQKKLFRNISATSKFGHTFKLMHK